MNDKAEGFKKRFYSVLSDLIWDKDLDERDRVEVLAYMKSHIDANLMYYTGLVKLLDEVEKEMGIE